jgi:ubiquinone/menaquinone biosynthesis C-methylase UbiE
MSPALDPLSLQFAIWTRTAPGYGLDVGCGDGIATAAALARGGRVMAVDPDQAALDQLLRRVPAEQLRRLRLCRSRLEELDFKFPSFSAVHASRVLHFLEPAAVEQSFRKFFRWLYPHGKLFISAFATSGSFRNETALRRELMAAGFIIEKCTSATLAWDAEHVCLNVIARCSP